jgi:hypothetical protein
MDVIFLKLGEILNGKLKGFNLLIKRLPRTTTKCLPRHERKRPNEVLGFALDETGADIDMLPSKTPQGLVPQGLVIESISPEEFRRGRIAGGGCGVRRGRCRRPGRPKGKIEQYSRVSLTAWQTRARSSGTKKPRAHTRRLD